MIYNNIHQFINNIEEIYKTINIYRGIIIIDNNKQNELLLLKDELINNNHNPIIVNHLHDINYNYRLFILTNINLLSKIKIENYNFIAIY